MDIGVPLKDLGPIDVKGLLKLVEGLTEEDWTGNTFRQDAVAAGAHSATDNILMKTEWHPSASTSGLQHFEDLVCVWARAKGHDPQPFLPIAREDTDVWPVYTMPDWLRFQEVLAPVVEQAIAPLKTPRGVVTRLALVRLKAGGHIAPHIDGHAMAARAHRIHVSLSSTPSVEYKIDGRKFTMAMGHAYDFNNRVRHSVRNNGKRERVNLFVDYYPNPGLVFRNPMDVSAPLYAPPTPRIN
ncbi:aspartyl/asparaginyl beta-hydroxylase domain-containing protein [Roseomonas marmotae]|uniref:Aspartyl/asparaginyl beta-hydroxylase domain-containing protein n=1 Tax=Roseomonas marmotae TaxID=2768161 RepID=A0ABS3KGJ8_9PROT|nr:aspartyl/asparaginyl beta-hydroxylase domain-containing protein [Roseomonas marmotae]MBO1076601.1 aspartyl/asparaginyl beta-hydroxylase domain-containing protein [Roseomonas marmotae]QTI79585.1 aspartyl/asparaginyl beta-hydroxylase domain-containing protein [Roseomonas marmotae]